MRRPRYFVGGALFLSIAAVDLPAVAATSSPLCAFVSPASCSEKEGTALPHEITRSSPGAVRHHRRTRIFAGSGSRRSDEWPLLHYDGEAIERYYSSRPWEVTDRIGSVGPPLLGWYLQTQLDNRTSRFVPENVVTTLNLNRASELRELLAKSGSVTFIKSGQALSLRQDVIKNAEYTRELARLQDEVGTFPNSIAFDIVEKDLGARMEDLFELMQPDPVASASIGQVYKARIRSTGEMVAVKVQRPDAFSSAAIDMFILRRFAAWFRSWKKVRTDLIGVADEFGRQLFSELDYEQEVVFRHACILVSPACLTLPPYFTICLYKARNAVKFKELYGHIPGIYIPDIYFDLTSRRVLTMEWIEGEKGPWMQDGERLLTIGLQCSVLQMLDSGFFHADCHRGNLLRMQDGRLAYLDFGMMCTVPPEERYALVGATLGLQNRDVRLVASSLVKMGFLPDESSMDVVVPALERAVNEASDGQGASRLNFTKLNTNVNALSAELQFRVPPFYSLIVRTLTMLEGLALSVDPDFRLVMGAYPYIAKQVLESESPEMRSLIQRTLLTDDGKIEWQRLEELVSIASAATVVDSEEAFTELKVAQSRSDLRKKAGFGDPISTVPEGAITFDVTLGVLDFVLSENGRFLREPLINDLLDTMDSLGVAVVNFASLRTGGLISPAEREVDVGRLDAVWSIISQVVANQRAAALKAAKDSGEEPDDLPVLRALYRSISSILRDPKKTAMFLPILRRFSLFAREVASRIVERQAVKAVKGAIGVVGSPRFFPFVARGLDAAGSVAGVSDRLIPMDDSARTSPRTNKAP